MEIYQDKLTESEELPHLVFKVRENYYAVDSKNVTSIMQYEGSEKLPNSPPEMVGIVIFREKAAPILDLRAVFRLPTIDQEYEEFVRMIDQRKADHVHWVSELERSVETDEKFKLTTDPHQCAFGRWYDNFKIDNNAIMFHLGKIKEPHENLHHAAIKLLRCKEENSTPEAQEACQANVMSDLKGKYMPTVLELLEEAKELFKNSYKKMVIMIGEENPVGLMVDEVLSVEYLEKGDTLDALGTNRSEILTHAMRSKRNSNIIYLLDEQKLFRKFRYAESVV